MRSPLVEQVRAGLADLAVLSGLLGIELRSSNGGVVRCPFHDDQTPSFSLFRGDRGWAGKCHGCGVKGDALALVARRRGLDTHGADFVRLLDQLGDELGLAHGVTAPKRPVARYTPPPVKLDDSAERYAVQARIHAVLLDVAPLGDEGSAYLRGRGLLDDEIPAEDWGLLPPPCEQRRVVDAIIAEIGSDTWCELSGLATGDGRGFVHPHARLVIPWRSGPGVQSQVALLQRRRIDAEKRGKYVGPAGISPPMPFGIEDAEIDGDGVALVLVEGALDVLALRRLARAEGLDWWIVGVPGVAHWHPTWAALAAERDAILAFDGDAAGEHVLAARQRDLLAAGARSVRRYVAAGGSTDWLDFLLASRASERRVA